MLGSGKHPIEAGETWPFLSFSKEICVVFHFHFKTFPSFQVLTAKCGRHSSVQHSQLYLCLWTSPTYFCFRTSFASQGLCLFQCLQKFRHVLHCAGWHHPSLLGDNRAHPWALLSLRAHHELPAVSVSLFLILRGWMHPCRAAAIHWGRGDCWWQHWSWGQSEWVDSGLVTRQLNGYALPCVCLFLSQGVLVMKPNVWFNWGLQRSNSSWGQLNCTSRFDLGSCQRSQGRTGVIGLQPLPLHSTLDTQHTDLLTHLYDCRPMSKECEESALGIKEPWAPIQLRKARSWPALTY